MKGAFADHQNQAAAFLEGHVGSPNQQVGADARRDGRHGVDRTGGNYHGINRIGAAGQAAGDVLQGVGVVRQGPHLRYGLSRLQEQGFLAGPGDDEVDLDGGVRPQPFQQTQTVDRAARSRYSYDDSQDHLDLPKLPELCSEFRTKLHPDACRSASHTAIIPLDNDLTRVNSRAPGSRLADTGSYHGGCRTEAQASPGAPQFALSGR